MKRKNEILLENILELLEGIGYKSKIESSKIRIPFEIYQQLLKANLIKEKIELPTHCPICGTSLEDVDEHENTFLLKCPNNHWEKIEKDERKYIEINYFELFKIFSLSLNLELTKVEDNGYYILGNLKYKNIDFYAVLLLTKLVKEKELYPIFKHSLIFKKPMIIFTPKHNIDKILEVQSLFSTGNLILILPIEKLRQFKRKILNWIITINEIINIENSIMSEIQTKYSGVINSISTNPRFLLTLLNQLEILKIEQKKDFDWEYLEELVAVSFSYLFISDLKFVGYKQKYENVPDNAFIIPNELGEPSIIGIVDCKSSKITNWDKELTEKYLKYFKKMRKLKSFSPSKLKIALIFVVFDFKKKSLESFYNRISKELNKNEYLVILPIESLIVLVYVMMNLILQTKLNIKEGKTKISKLFEKDYFKLLKKKYAELMEFDDIIFLPPNIVVEELKQIISENSNYELLLESYFSESLDNVFSNKTKD